jgi:hypothetical protein
MNMQRRVVDVPAIPVTVELSCIHHPFLLCSCVSSHLLLAYVLVPFLVLRVLLPRLGGVVSCCIGELVDERLLTFRQ